MHRFRCMVPLVPLVLKPPLVLEPPLVLVPVPLPLPLVLVRILPSLTVPA